MLNESSRSLQTTANGTSYYQIYFASNGQNSICLVPASVINNASAKPYVFLVAMGTGDNEGSINASRFVSTRDGLLDRGHVLVSTKAHSDVAWANEQSLLDFIECRRIVGLETYKPAGTFVHGLSMGGITCANLGMNNRISDLVGWISIDGVLGFEQFLVESNDPTDYQSLLNAYGASDPTDFRTKTPGRDPLLSDVPSNAYAGQYIFIEDSSNDGVVLNEKNSTPFINKFGGTAHITFVDKLGGHVSEQDFAAVEVLNWVDSTILTIESVASGLSSVLLDGYSVWEVGTGWVPLHYWGTSSTPVVEAPSVTIVNAVGKTNQIDLTWTSTGNSTGYTVKIGSNAAVNVSGTTYSATSIAAGTYDVTVTSLPSNVSDTKTVTVVAPINLTLSQSANNGVTASWTSNGTGDYTVTFNSNNYITSNTTYTVPYLVAGHTYTMKVAGNGYTEEKSLTLASADFTKADSNNVPTITTGALGASAVSPISGSAGWFREKRLSVAEANATSAGNIQSSTNALDITGSTRYRYPTAPATVAGRGSNPGQYVSTDYKVGSSASVQAARWLFNLDFTTSSATVALRLVAPVAAPRLGMIFVNGRKIQDKEYTLSGLTAGSGYYALLTFPDARQRRIQIYSLNHVEGAWGGVSVASGQTITKPTPTINNRVAFIGDSYVNGAYSNGDGGYCMETFAWRLGKHMGADDVVYAGIGGTGFVNQLSTGTDSLFRARVDPVLAMNPHQVWFCGLRNDASSAAADITTNVGACLDAVPAGIKKGVISTASNTSTTAIAAAKAACDARGVPFIQVDVDGLAKLSDNVHFTWNSHQTYADRIAAAMY